jgi:hypothetical protein
MEAIRDHESGEYDKRADLFDRRTLVEIMKEVYGHPLAASNAIKYIIRVRILSHFDIFSC